MPELSEIVKSGKFYVLDTETTGLDRWASICQIAVVDANGNAIINELVKPNAPIPQEATAIHGITNEMVSNAPDFTVIYHYMMNTINTSYPVFIYNASFDLRMIKQSKRVNEHGLKDVYCVMEAFANHYGDWNEYHQSNTWKPLSFACSYYGIPVTNAHEALGDCLMTLAVVKKLWGGS